MSDVTVTAHTADDHRPTPMAFEEGADIMVVAIHRQKGITYVASFDSHSRDDETPLAYCGESIIAALQTEGVTTR